MHNAHSQRWQMFTKAWALSLSHSYFISLRSSMLQSFSNRLDALRLENPWHRPLVYFSQPCTRVLRASENLAHFHIVVIFVLIPWFYRVSEQVAWRGVYIFNIYERFRWCFGVNFTFMGISIARSIGDNYVTLSCPNKSSSHQWHAAITKLDIKWIWIKVTHKSGLAQKKNLKKKLIEKSFFFRLYLVSCVYSACVLPKIWTVCLVIALC